MNKNKLSKCVGQFVRLRPMALRYDGASGLPQIDDDWRVDRVEDEGVRLQNIRTAHTVLLGYDHIHNYTSDAGRQLGQQKYGFLQLNVRIMLHGIHADIEPIDPREKATTSQIIDKWVNLPYIDTAGIAKDLRDQGFDLCWSTANDESTRTDIEGWEQVLICGPNGTLMRLKIRDHPIIGGYLILLRRRNLVT
jgi:hypothetical protein